MGALAEDEVPDERSSREGGGALAEDEGFGRLELERKLGRCDDFLAFLICLIFLLRPAGEAATGQRHLRTYANERS